MTQDKMFDLLEPDTHNITDISDFIKMLQSTKIKTRYFPIYLGTSVRTLEVYYQVSTDCLKARNS